MKSSDLKHTNKLIHAGSPYLLQHAHNPVNWYEWGEEALARARHEKKPLLVSIGYSACHWCHVMAHESFEDEHTAALMNEHFVCVKVDREERPDIDHVYMDACQLVSGRGGWPLNAFALPDGTPFHAGTYFPREQWQSLLLYLADLWRKDPHEVEAYAAKLAEGVRATSIVKTTGNNSRPDITAAYNTMAEQFDHVFGGPDREPKFPMPVNYEFLLDYALLHAHESAGQFARFTLEQMALGGLFDQVGGGFARYSVDKKWFAPHFEKMLYDNAQLISLYSKAFVMTGDVFFNQVIEKTIAFCNRELLHAAGAYFSALDADSEGEEGKFYVWHYDELQHALGEDAEVFCKYYQVVPEGNWEHGRNILYAVGRAEDAAPGFGMTAESFSKLLERCHSILFGLREQRVRPGLDDKILSSWNALMLKGLADAYLATRNDTYLQHALKLEHFIRTKLMLGNALKRTWKNGEAKIDAFSEDYATLIQALISLYRCDYNEAHLLNARYLTEQVINSFYNSDEGLFHFTPAHTEVLVSHKYDISDDVIPSANAIMAENLIWLGYVFVKPEWLDLSNRMLGIASGHMQQYPAWHALWLRLACLKEKGIYQVEAMGKNISDELATFQPVLYPNVILLVSEQQEASRLPLLQDKTTGTQQQFYVCCDNTCFEPVNSLDEALALLKQQ